MPAPSVPLSTYRLQLSGAFTLADAARVVPYLAELGVSDVYASPILRARAGSTHGYDVADPATVSPELGGEGALRGLSEALRTRGMGLLCDVVPNHMAATVENPWWWDVLENGRASAFAGHFDIAWDAPASPGRVVLPVLGAPIDEVIAKGEIRPELDGASPVVRCAGSKLPIEPASLGLLLSHALDLAGEDVSEEARGRLGRLAAAAAGLPPHTSPDESGRRRSTVAAFKAELGRALEADASLRAVLERAIADYGAGGECRERLAKLLAAQPYELAFWKEGVQRINYRRFFDISDLAGLRAEDPRVFDDTHATTLRLVAEGIITGLRIDHIDGLRDPLAYLQRLRGRLADAGRPGGSGGYVVVEKILGAGEALPEDWPCEGTTGYDFLVALDHVFVDPDGVAEIRRHAHEAAGAPLAFLDVAYRGKVEALERLFVAEVSTLAADLAELSAASDDGPPLPVRSLREAIVQVSACLPVYRTYLRGDPVADQDRAWIDRAIEETRRRSPAQLAPAIGFLRDVLLRTADDPRALAFAQRWQQLTGPAAAKGVEDTALYRDIALVSLNEVGGEPTVEGDPVEAFHRFNAARAASWPAALSASSTHDTKRSEDVRARISVLSEIPGEWTAALERWRDWNRPACSGEGEDAAPSAADETLIYQSLLGAWPLDDRPDEAFIGRLQRAMIKSVREAKQRTSWTDPDERYERGIERFIASILDSARESPFLFDFRALQARTSFHGMLNALAQTALKLAAPGVPDMYRGAELWDLSLVDPDNRRPVDFELRRRVLSDLRERSSRDLPGLLRDMVADWSDGRPKMYLIWRALALRRASPAFGGSYAPLKARGERARHVCSFLRERDGAAVVAVAPRLTVSLVRGGRCPLGEAVWGSTRLELPPGAPGAWTNVLTGETLHARDGSLEVAEALRAFPVALLSASDR